jgi:hypothetical protein
MEWTLTDMQGPGSNTESPATKRAAQLLEKLIPISFGHMQPPALATDTSLPISEDQ